MMRGASKRMAMAVVLGAVAAAMYGSVALSALFLVPIQAAGTAWGFGAMLAAAAASGLGIAAWQVILLVSAGQASGAALALGLSAPLALLLAIVALAWPRLARLSFPLKALAAGTAAALACVPSMATAWNDPGIRSLFEETFKMAAKTVGADLPDSAALWTTVRNGIASAFGGVLFVFLFMSAWIGTAFGKIAAKQRASDGTAIEPADAIAAPPPLRDYAMPPYLVWALLAAWAALLVARFKPSFFISAVASNAAIALSICYGVQGLAVAGALAERAGMATAARLFGPVVVFLALFGGKIGIAVAGLVAVVGTLETWIPFRRAAKGAQR